MRPQSENNRQKATGFRLLGPEQNQLKDNAKPKD